MSGLALFVGDVKFILDHRRLANKNNLKLVARNSQSARILRGTMESAHRLVSEIELLLGGSKETLAAIKESRITARQRCRINFLPRLLGRQSSHHTNRPKKYRWWNFHCSRQQ
jgi:hypothetical protein